MSISDARTVRWLLSPTSAAIPAIAAGVLLAAQVVLFVGIQSVLSRPVPGGRPFRIERIPNGAVISQTLAVQSNGLEAIHIAGDVTGHRSSGLVDATLVELLDDGAEREVATAVADASAACCTFVFQPVQRSAGKRFRLDMRVRGFEPSTLLSLNAVPVAEGDGLTINSRAQAARLIVGASATGGTAFARLRSGAVVANRVSLAELLGIFLVLDAAVVACVTCLVKASVTACRPRPS